MFSNPFSKIVSIIDEPKDMTDTYINIEELLPTYCEGLATAEEARRVEEWMELDEANRKMVKQIQMLNMAADTLHVMQCVDSDKAFQKVKTKIVPPASGYYFAYRPR